MIKAVLFDLDGTLLPMDNDEFIRVYFSHLAKRVCSVKGYDVNRFTKSIWGGLKAMVTNDGSKTNEQAWWDFYVSQYGETALNDEQLFYDFYVNEFNNAQSACNMNPKADQVIKLVKEKGLMPVLATNPVFPSVATENRIRWAGMDKDDFELFTTYEHYCYAKPNLNYYKEILEKLGLSGDECVMVGNDVDEDAIAEQLGMKVFLLTECLINRTDKDISNYPQGSFDDLIEFITNI